MKTTKTDRLCSVLLTALLLLPLAAWAQENAEISEESAVISQAEAPAAEDAEAASPVHVDAQTARALRAVSATNLPPTTATIVGSSGEEYVIYKAGHEPVAKPSPIVWEGNVATLGSVRLDTATRSVTATGWVNQASGIVELLACGPRGKVHESIFVLSVNPLDLQAALLLAGLRGGEVMPGLGLGPALGSPVDMWVDWTDPATSEPRRARAETFVRDIEADAPLPDGPWVFTGSVVYNGRFKALAEESLVATFWDPFAIVNNPYANGGDDHACYVNTDLVPPEGTAITYTFVPAAEHSPLHDTVGLRNIPARTRYGY